MVLWAQAVLSAHAERKSVLEVEFVGEEGTGLGPSLEFYALVAAELQARTLALWLCDDAVPDDLAREVRDGPRWLFVSRLDACVRARVFVQLCALESALVLCLWRLQSTHGSQSCSVVSPWAVYHVDWRPAQWGVTGTNQHPA